MTEDNNLHVYDRRLAVQYLPWARRMDFYLTGKDEIGKRYRAVVEFVPIEDGNMEYDQSFSIGEMYIPEFLEYLWNTGLRPKGMESSDQVINAKDEHIKDLRQIKDKFLTIVDRRDI